MVSGCLRVVFQVCPVKAARGRKREGSGEEKEDLTPTILKPKSPSYPKDFEKGLKCHVRPPDPSTGRSGNSNHYLAHRPRFEGWAISLGMDLVLLEKEVTKFLKGSLSDTSSPPYSTASETFSSDIEHTTSSKVVKTQGKLRDGCYSLFNSVKRGASISLIPFHQGVGM